MAVKWMVTWTTKPPSTCSTMAGPAVNSTNSTLLENSGGRNLSMILNGTLSLHQHQEQCSK